MRNYYDLDLFLDARLRDIGWTLADNYHAEVAHDAVKVLVEKYGLGAGSRVLDVGCGVGRDLLHFRSLGAEVDGLTAYFDEGFEEGCKERGIKVTLCDFNFPPKNDYKYDYIFARHVLEHSVMPYFMLTQLNRQLKLNGVMYVEVPAPGMVVEHEKNHNHYSIMGKQMWEEMFRRGGFQIDYQKDWYFTGRIEGKEEDELLDTWWAYGLVKEREV